MKTYLEQTIEQKAKDRFNKEFTSFIKMINDNPIGHLLRIKVVDIEDEVDFLSLTNFYGTTGGTLFNAKYSDLTKYGKELTNIEAIKDELLDKFIQEETTNLFDKIKILGDYIKENPELL